MQFVVRFHTLLHQAEAGLNEEELLPGPILFHILAHSLSGSLICPRSLHFIVSFLHLEMTKENEAAGLRTCRRALN